MAINISIPSPNTPLPSDLQSAYIADVMAHAASVLSGYSASAAQRLIPPAAPSELKASLANGVVSLTWTASPTPDIGYIATRQPSDGSAITAIPVSGTQSTDHAPSMGSVNGYSVVAVSSYGVISQPVTTSIFVPAVKPDFTLIAGFSTINLDNGGTLAMFDFGEEANNGRSVTRADGVIVRLFGYNAGHVYDRPGIYKSTVTPVTIDKEGNFHYGTAVAKSVLVTADTRRHIPLSSGVDLSAAITEQHVVYDLMDTGPFKATNCVNVPSGTSVRGNKSAIAVVTATGPYASIFQPADNSEVSWLEVGGTPDKASYIALHPRGKNFLSRGVVGGHLENLLRTEPTTDGVVTYGLKTTGGQGGDGAFLQAGTRVSAYNWESPGSWGDHDWRPEVYDDRTTQQFGGGLVPSRYILIAGGIYGNQTRANPLEWYAGRSTECNAIVGVTANVWMRGGQNAATGMGSNVRGLFIYRQNFTTPRHGGVLIDLMTGVSEFAVIEATLPCVDGNVPVSVDQFSSGVLVGNAKVITDGQPVADLWHGDASKADVNEVGTTTAAVVPVASNGSSSSGSASH